MTESKELQELKTRYQELLKRVDKAIAYFENPDVPFQDKEKHFETFRQLLHQTSLAGYEITNWEEKA